MSYSELHNQAKKKAELLLYLGVTLQRQIVLIHFRTHLENIIWFWASVLAGCVPCMSTPLVNNDVGCKLHFNHLHSVLEDPIVLTNQKLKDHDFVKNSVLRVVVVDDLEIVSKLHCPMAQICSNSVITNKEEHQKYGAASELDLAMLLLTSGSTGNAKAVCLSHKQLYASFTGKLAALPLPSNSALLNWIGLDHVASLVEVHLCAMFAGLDQVHVPAATVISDPLLFLVLLSRHGVSRTFSPHFFLHKLQKALEAVSADKAAHINLHRLRYIASGGEPNAVQVCARLTDALMNLGAPNINTITPGFGMTETCAGAIFNRNFPAADLDAGNEFASLGRCMPGIEMRVTSTAHISDDDDTIAITGIVGELEIRGEVVFERYLNNEQATQDALTSDGWFKTGDLASIDINGGLKYAGRLREEININGVKYLPHEIEDAIIRAAIPGLAASAVVCVRRRPLPDSSTEGFVVVYEHTYEREDVASRMETLKSITRVVSLFSGVRPRVLPLPPDRLAKSSLGKLSRPKIEVALAQGEYVEEEDIDNRICQSYRSLHYKESQTETERMLMRVVMDTLDMSEGLGIDTSILDTGVHSVDLIRLKRAAETAFGIQDVPMLTIMTHVTIRSLSKALEDMRHVSPQHHRVATFNPVVTLQPNGEKPALWLIHPGIGEVLVFLGLAQHFPDRPIYAMRARGFNAGEMPFKSLQEVLTTYYHALKQQQPQGPYAIVGYSYGSMIAFELAKLLESDGDTVQFLGSLNLPPHIKDRMRTLDWTAGALHIAQFCGIITDEQMEHLRSDLLGIQKEQQVARIFAVSDKRRCEDLALTPEYLYTWTNVAWSLQKIGWEYDPSATVAHMDIFYCQPLKAVARTREEYRNTKLNHWIDFVRDEARYHEVDGEHYTMIDSKHVYKFQQILKKAMDARGL
jgi:acyl-CoA synthetase (AMP-forming)/AMP-acid ligase II/thioesterase domain-containing protein